MPHKRQNIFGDWALRVKKKAENGSPSFGDFSSIPLSKRAVIDFSK